MVFISWGMRIACLVYFKKIRKYKNKSKKEKTTKPQKNLKK